MIISDRQRRWAHTQAGKLALGAGADAAGFDIPSTDLKLPPGVKFKKPKAPPKAAKPPAPPKMPRVVSPHSPTVRLLGLSSPTNPVLGVRR